MVRRTDVARLAGTSPAVVSYVLNGGPPPCRHRPRQSARRDRAARLPPQRHSPVTADEPHHDPRLLIPDNANLT